MKRRILQIFVLLLTALLFAGCTPLTVAEMYAIPKRSEEYAHLQSAIDMAMAGLSYSAPISGENQQTVQMADLDGDGVEEYLVFAKGNTEKPLQILIFSQTEEGKCQIMTVIESNGSAFEQVEYVEIDHTPGCEIVVGRQVSDQLMGNVSIYSFKNGYAKQIMTSGYSRFLTCDLDKDDKGELVLIQPGESTLGTAVALLYNFRNGEMERSVEAELSCKTEDIRRVAVSNLQDGYPAVYVASAMNDNSIVTDVLTLKRGKFTNVSTSSELGTSVQTLRNYAVYGEDLDRDGVFELPKLVSMQLISMDYNIERQYLIRWYSMDSQGKTYEKLYTFHNYAGGWYIQLSSELAERVTIEQMGNTYIFYLWNDTFTEAVPLYTIYVMTGSDRETQANADNRFLLYRTDEVVYAARLEPVSAEYGITKDSMINSFGRIHQDWRTSQT